MLSKLKLCESRETLIQKLSIKLFVIRYANQKGVHFWLEQMQILVLPEHMLQPILELGECIYCFEPKEVFPDKPENCVNIFMSVPSR
jgi:hypothetical protein